MILKNFKIWRAIRTLVVVAVVFSHSVMSNFLRPHELQHTKLLCPLSSPRACSNSCPLSWWYHPTISSSVDPFSCLQSFLASGSCPVSWLFALGGQSIGVSASASILPMTIQGWFPLGLTVCFPCRPRDSWECSPTPQFRSINTLMLSFLYGLTFTSIHDYWKNHSLDCRDLCRQSNISAVV